jgi:hypothetical protein
MHPTMRDLLRAELRNVVDQLIDARREGSAIELTRNTKLTAKDRVISELYAKIGSSRRSSRAPDCPETKPGGMAVAGEVRETSAQHNI